MSNYPTSIDDDSTLPPINDNLDDLGEAAVNALRDAVVNIEEFVGTGVPGQMSLAQRLGLLVQPDGYFNFSYLTSMGLVTLPIYDNQIADAANIQESKLSLTFGTQDLYNDIAFLAQGVNTVTNWISVSGVKLEPHLIGAIYRHDLTQIDVIENPIYYLNSVFRSSVGVNINRIDHNGSDNVNAFLMLNNINNELTFHQWADGTQPPYTLADGYVTRTIQNIITNGGYTFPSNYAHTAGGIYLDTSGFSIIPQTATDIQSALSYIDQSSLFLLGSRVQNLYSNGISINSRSSALNTDGYGPIVVSSTPATTYLRGTGTLSSPKDNITMGDDMIHLFPTEGQQDGYLFDAQFALIRTGDIIIVNFTSDGYNIEIPYVISEKKYIISSDSFFVRIAGKNVMYAPNATATIYRPLFNNNKYGVLSVASGATIGSGISPSLIVGNPNGAQCAGVGFNPDQFDPLHYLLYLELYPYGNPLDGYAIQLPGIDVTGNAGATPGLYTLSSIVQATNNAFRQPGFNYRFTAFEFKGEFGIIADPYNNASFSVISATVTDGYYANNGDYLYNVVDLFPAAGASVAQDPLGFGPNGSGIASPPFSASYDTIQSASGFPTRVFNALQQNNYYVNGAERQNLNSDIYQTFDAYGDGYWPATIDGYFAGNPQSTIYSIAKDLSASGLKAGKTIVVQPYGANLGTQVNYGRFVIQDVQFLTDLDDNYLMTQITVFNSVHATGSLSSSVAPKGSQVGIYFSSDSVSFDEESSIDPSTMSGPFKRHFEVYVDSNGDTYTHERARAVLVNTISQLDIVTVASTLRGYVPVSGPINSITLCILTLSAVTGIYDGYMWDGINANTVSATITGRLGEIVRFYDQTNIDYIDIIFELNNVSITTLATSQSITFQLFPSLALDQEVMLIASCQENTSSPGTVTQIKDRREFGNVSSEQLTTSALNYISAGDKHLHFNGIIRGFDIANNDGYGNFISVPVTGVTYGMIAINGGLALVDGNLTSINNQVFIIPPIAEVSLLTGMLYPINYALCVNSESELVTIALTDYDPVIITNSVNPRAVSVVNRTLPASLAYQIDSCNFSYLLNNRKDLTVLYIVSSVVTGVGPTIPGPGATTALTIRDVRRFVNDADSSLPAVLTDDKSQGNFETLASAVNWLTFNSLYQNTLLIKGTNTISSPVIFTDGLQIIGGGIGATIVVNTSLTISNVSFSNITINVNISNAFIIGSNVTFNNCVFNYSYDTTLDGYHYSSADLVNASSGMIYCNIGQNDVLDNLNIIDCTFYTLKPDHFPLVSIQFSDPTAYAANINITKNIFISQTAEDIRAVIALSSTALSNGYEANPTIVNMVINNNVCNQDQLIIVTCAPAVNNVFIGGLQSLIVINSSISNNICGTIGYFTSAGNTTDFSNITTNINGIFDKFDKLTISKNTCHYIGNLDIFGRFIEFYDPYDHVPSQTVHISTGQVSITENTTSWIGAGAFGNTGSPGMGVQILNNTLTPANSIYLNNYTNKFGQGPDNIGINLLSDNNNVGNTQSIISGNILIQNQLLNSSGDPSGPYYYNNGIGIGNNALVTGNIVNGVINNSAPIIIVGNTLTATVSNNVLTRAGQNILGYIVSISNSASIVTIIDNVFDSVYTDGTTSTNGTIFNDLNNGIPSNWNYIRNTNQVSYAAVPLYAHRASTNISGFNSAMLPIGNSIASTLNFDGLTSPFTDTLFIRLADVLPYGVKLLYATVGIVINTVLETHASPSYIFMQVFTNVTNVIATPILPTSFTTGLPLIGSIVDVFTFPSTINIDYPTTLTIPGSSIIDFSTGASGTANVAAIKGGTVFLNLDMNGSATQMYIGKEYETVLSLKFNNVTTSSTSGNAIFSPIVLRYIWG